MIPLPSSRRLPTLALLLGLLLWTPLPFGSVTPLGILVIRLAVSAAVVTCVWSVEGRRDLREIRLPALGLLGLGVLGLAQSLSWPGWVSALVAPGHPGPEATLESTGARAMALSLAPAASRSIALTTLTLGALLLVSWRVGRSRRMRGWLLAGFGAAAAVQALIGLRNWLAHSTLVFGTSVEGPLGRLRGTFVNPDHAALYFEIALSVAFAWCWWALKAAKGSASLERRLAAVGLPAILWVGLFLCFVLTGSRAGLLAAGLGIVLQGLIVASPSGRWRLALLGLLPGAVGAALILALARQEGLVRYLTSSVYDVLNSERLEVWGESWRLWTGFPWTGTGLGTFGEAFPLVQSADLVAVRWGRAHNDWLELLVTGGLVGAALLAVGAAAAGLRCWRIFHRGCRTHDRAAALAALGAMTAVGFHELVDFGATIPANAVALTVLVGLACAGRIRGEREESPGRDAGDRRPGSRPPEGEAPA